MSHMNLTSEEKRLEDAADAFLRKQGYRWDGRLRKEVGFGQCRFEKRARPNPYGGWSTRKHR